MFVRRRCRNGYDASLAHRLVQGVAELLVREILSVEVAREEVLVGFDDRLDKLLPIGPDAVCLFLRKLGDRAVRSLEYLPMQQIDRRLELLVLSNEHVQRHDADPVGLSKLLQHPAQVAMLAIEDSPD